MGNNIYNNSHAGVAQLVERDLAKVEVAGSSPVTRSFFISNNSIIYILLFIYFKESL